MSETVPLEPGCIRLKGSAATVARDPARFVVWIAGRRSGKTVAAVGRCIVTASQKRGANVWYIGPTFDMVRDLAWDFTKQLLPPAAVFSVNETRLQVVLVNGSTISLKSGDRPDRNRGKGLDLAVFDEFAYMEKANWDAVRPGLSDRAGRGMFISSPAGYNWAYDFYLRGVGGTEADWRSYQTTTLQGGWVTAAEIEAARHDLDPRMFRQEYEASFETLEGRVYSNFAPVANVRALEDIGGDLLVGMDFNVHPMTAVVAVQAGDECHILDALELPISNTEEMAQELRRRYPDRRIIVCPDPSGRARKTSAPVGQTDFTILQRAGFTVDAPNAAPPVVDRINNVQALLRSAAGRSRLFVSPKAMPLIRALSGLCYKEGANVPDKSGGLDHITDALGYLCWARFKELAPKAAQRPFAA